MGTRRTRSAAGAASRPDNAAPPPRDKRQLHVPGDPSKSVEQQLADVTLEPAASGVATVLAFAKATFGENDLTSLYEGVRAQIAAVASGHLDGPEAILVAQASSLNMIFTELARRSAANMGEYIEASERYMRLALKAQAQCRATIETLATLKNPPIVYARQANIAAGHQQINNYAPTPAASPAGNPKDQPNELLEVQNAECLEHRAPSPAARGDPPVETVGTIDGPDDRSRKAALQPKR